VHLYNTKCSALWHHLIILTRKTKNLTGKNFLHCPNIQTSSKTQPASHSMGTGGVLSPGTKQLDHGADHSPSSVALKNEYSYTLLPPYAIMACTGQLHHLKGWQCYADQQAFVLDSRITDECHNNTRVLSDDDYS